MEKALDMASGSDRVVWLPIKVQELSYSRKCHAERFLRPWSSKSCTQWKQAWGARNVPSTDHRGFPVARRGLLQDATVSRAEEFLNSDLASLLASHVERAADEGVNIFAEAPIAAYLGRTNEVVCDHGWCNRSVKSPSRIASNRGRCQSAGVRRPTSASSGTRARPRTAVPPNRPESRGTSDAGSTAGSDQHKLNLRHPVSRKADNAGKDITAAPRSAVSPCGASQGASDGSFRGRNRPASAVSRPPDSHSCRRRESQRRPESAPSQLPTAPTHGAVADRRGSGSSQGSLQGVMDASLRAAEQRALVSGGTPQFGRDALAWAEDSRFEVVTLDTDRSSLDQVLG
mmetsp:Transcript_74862/g.199578  ORF Transcript_74862/g.199578 Transcript_74862/m.199578 type:complete len:344 (+) Transcript_74862:159-1190(+)